ncbi:MAG: 2-oxoacid:ferredoxin oxidoreductase subunit beta [Halanaerobiaceae bacterium]
MTILDSYEIDRETAWCPGCGNFPLRKALANALADLDLKPDDVTMFTGIGQAAKMLHYLRINGFNGLHGRALPPSIGMRVANPEMKVIVESGDGDTYGEGGNHILHNIRRNPDIAHLVHDNQIYGLTKGQASPTTGYDIKTAVQPQGINATPFNPIRFAVGMKASFVARAFVGEGEHLQEMIKAAINHKGYALVDILQPCVSFNPVNTYQWYKERVYKLDDDYYAEDYTAAVEKAEEWEDKIPIGIIYQEEKPTFRERIEHLNSDEKLIDHEINPADLEFLLDDYR